MYAFPSSSHSQAAQPGGQFGELEVWVLLALRAANKCTRLQKDLWVNLLGVEWEGVGGLPAMFFHCNGQWEGRRLRPPKAALMSCPHAGPQCDHCFGAPVTCRQSFSLSLVAVCPFQKHL